ncbi:MAG: MoxR family ATPase [Nocardioides sp.]|uniref:AAA family ATPase n=1 Tax=Nocardioides sp. TaxID=35761 RepID=UPI0039E2B379
MTATIDSELGMTEVELNPLCVPVERLARVPEPATGYVSRTNALGLNRSDFDVLDYAHRHAYNVLIEGPTGLGKTSAVIAWAARNGKPFYAISSNVAIDPSQLFGKFVPAGLGGFRWQDGPLTDVVRYGGVLLINEINFLPERISTVLFSLLDARREITLLDHDGEVIAAHPDLLIIGDLNPDYEGTRPLNKALRNRFAIQMVWGYDDAIEGQLIRGTSLHELAGLLRRAQRDGDVDAPVSTGMLVEFERIATGLGLDAAVANLLNHFPTDEERKAVAVVVEAMADNLATDYAPKGA